MQLRRNLFNLPSGERWEVTCKAKADERAKDQLSASCGSSLEDLQGSYARGFAVLVSKALSGL